MAALGDIVTTVAIDDSQFQRIISAMESSTKKFADNTQKSLTKTENSFTGLGNAIAGIGFAKLITDSMNLGKELTSLSDSTGISIKNIKGLQDAFTAAGGTSSKASDGLTDLVKNIGEAANSGGDLSKAFGQVGVSLTDLQNSSEKDILRKVISGLAAIPDSATRSSLAMKLMGDAAKGIDWTKVNSSIDGYVERSGKVESSARAAAAAQKTLEESFNNIKTGVLSGLQPLSENIAKLAKFTDAISTVVDIAVRIATVIATFWALGKVIQVGVIAFSALAAGIEAAGGIIAIVSNAFRQFGLIWEQLQLLGGPLTGTIKVLRANIGELGSWALKSIPGLGALAAGIYSLGDYAKSAYEDVKKFFNIKPEDDGSYDKKELARAEAIKQQGEERKRNLKFLEDEKKALDAQLASYSQSNGELIKKIGLETSLIGKGETYKRTQQELFSAESGYLSEITKLKEQYIKASSPEQQAQISTAMKELTDSYLKQRDSIQKAYSAQETKTRQNELELFQKDQLVQSNQKLYSIQDQISKLNLSEVQKQYYDLEVAVKRTAEAAIQAEEKRRGARLSQAEEQAYYDAAKQGLNGLKQATEELAAAEAKRRQTLALKQEEITANREIQKIQDDIAKLTMTEMEKKERDITRAVEQRRDAMIAAEEAARGATLNAQERAVYEAKANDEIQRTIAETKKYEDASRSWSTGWKQAMNDYVRNATDGASKAKSIFGKAMSGMEDLLIEFGKSGKFEWKKFVSMMLEELIRAQIQMIFAKMLGGMQDSMKSTSGNMLSNLLGGATGNAGTAGTAGQQGSGVSGGGSLLSGLGNIVSGIGDFFSSGYSLPADQAGPVKPAGAGYTAATGIWDTISSVGSGILDAVSGIGDFFGGFFADGGKLGAGKWGIAGEAGPELIQGPASITPMDQMQGGAGSTNLNVTINAVDAMSFKQLVASDPSFIYGVAMQGAKGVPARR